MTRRRLICTINTCLDDHPADAETTEIIMDCTLRYLQDYVQQLSEQLMAQHFHSEAMAAGTVLNKIKMLLSEDND